jgi:hypothetical protein
MRFVTDQSQLFWIGMKICDCNFWDVPARSASNIIILDISIDPQI